jgi:hypothetical protein
MKIVLPIPPHIQTTDITKFYDDHILSFSAIIGSSLLKKKLVLQFFCLRLFFVNS